MLHSSRAPRNGPEARAEQTDRQCIVANGRSEATDENERTPDGHDHF
jgi:hypothetical protein